MSSGPGHVERARPCRAGPGPCRAVRLPDPDRAGRRPVRSAARTLAGCWVIPGAGWSRRTLRWRCWWPRPSSPRHGRSGVRSRQGSPSPVWWCSPAGGGRDGRCSWGPRRISSNWRTFPGLRSGRCCCPRWPGCWRAGGWPTPRRLRRSSAVSAWRGCRRPSRSAMSGCGSTSCCHCCSSVCCRGCWAGTAGCVRCSPPPAGSVPNSSSASGGWSPARRGCGSGRGSLGTCTTRSATS